MHTDLREIENLTQIYLFRDGWIRINSCASSAHNHYLFLIAFSIQCSVSCVPSNIHDTYSTPFKILEVIQINLEHAI